MNHNNYIVFDLVNGHESVGWENNGEKYFYKDCLCVFQEHSVQVSKPWFSITPLFYAFQKEIFIISENWLTLLAVSKSHDFDTSPDREYIQSYLQYQCAFTNTTLCSEIKFLRGGESVSIRDNVLSNEFLSFEKKQHSYPKDQFSRDIEQSLKKIDFKRSAFQLSSGLDSSILAIMAAQLSDKRDLNFVSCITKGHGCSDEIENVKKLSCKLGADLQVFDFSDIDIFTEGENLVQKCLGYPTAHPSHLVEFLLDRECSKQFDFVISGRGPDECLAGYEWHNERFSNLHLHKKRVMTTDPSLLSLLLLKKGKDAYDQFVFDKIKSGSLSLESRLKYDLLTISESWNIITGAVSDCLDIKVVSPFLKKSVRAGMFFLPDDAKLDSGNGKIFMKKAFQGLYPEYIINFPKRGLRLDLKPYFNEYSCDEIFKKINFNPGFISTYFSISQIKEMITKTKETDGNYGWQLWSIYLLALSAKNLDSKGPQWSKKK